MTLWFQSISLISLEYAIKQKGLSIFLPYFFLSCIFGWALESNNRISYTGFIILCFYLMVYLLSFRDLITTQLSQLISAQIKTLSAINLRSDTLFVTFDDMSVPKLIKPRLDTWHVWSRNGQEKTGVIKSECLICFVPNLTPACNLNIINHGSSRPCVGLTSINWVIKFKSRESFLCIFQVLSYTAIFYSGWAVLWTRC